MLKNTPKIQDQYTDRSGKTLLKIAANLADQELRDVVTEALYDLPDRLSKMAEVAHFCTDTAADTLLSSVYFEGQKQLMKEAEAQALGEHLATMRALYDLPDIEFAQVKTAADKPEVELMPGVVVHDYTELMKVGSDFEANYRRLDYRDRVIFSRTFAKYAAESADMPESVCLYAGVGTALRDDAVEQLHFRKAAADRAGKDGSCYTKLAAALANIDPESTTDKELAKLASLVFKMDNAFGFTGTDYDKRLPDAWHALLKKAESTNNDSGISDRPMPGMSKSDIVAQFGEQALDEIENPDGSINQARLRQIMALFGDEDDKRRMDNDNPNTPNPAKANTEGDKRGN